MCWHSWQIAPTRLSSSRCPIVIASGIPLSRAASPAECRLLREQVPRDLPAVRKSFVHLLKGEFTTANSGATADSGGPPVVIVQTTTQDAPELEAALRVGLEKEKDVGLMSAGLQEQVNFRLREEVDAEFVTSEFAAVGKGGVVPHPRCLLPSSRFASAPPPTAFACAVAEGRAAVGTGGEEVDTDVGVVGESEFQKLVAARGFVGQDWALSEIGPLMQNRLLGFDRSRVHPAPSYRSQ